MKAIFTICLALFCVVAIAQDKVITHTATVANSTGSLTLIDHPDLNGNPGAYFIITHNLDVGGVKYNNQVSGTYYNGAQWGIYNEDASNIIEGSSYNVYIPGGGNLTTVQAPGTSYILDLDHAAINNNPNAIIVSTSYYNPSSVYNNYNYGVYYTTATGRWSIYNEKTIDNIPTNAAFNLLIDDGTGGATSFVHHATSPTANYTTIDDSSLNGKPDAYPVVTHNWGTSGDPSNIIMDVTLGVWYSTGSSKWTIFTEDNSSMPLNAAFNVYVAPPVLAIDDNTALSVRSYPNPTTGIITITAQEEFNEVAIYNILGQEVKRVTGDNNSITIDLSAFASGQYIARVQAGSSVESIRIIKQ